MFSRKNIFLVSLFVNISLICFSQTEFITTWETTSASESITIPTSGGGYNYNVNWGDGSPDDTGVTGSVSHVYTVAGTYTVTITGTFNRIYFNGNATNAPKIQSIEQWGSSRIWTSMNRAFDGCSNLVNNATDVPILSSVTSCQRMFRNASSIGTGSATNWNSWGTSNITNMSQMFRGASSFNENLNSWITSSVTNMSNMFRDATNFNGNISSWNTSSVTNMSRVFQNASSFNQNISGWNTASVTTMSYMFSGASSFNQNINGWTVTSVTNMDEIFRNATNFNQSLNSWNVSNVTNMNEAFRNATNFNGNISSWTPTSVTNMGHMFRDASSFNQDISGWNTTTVTNMSNMFYNASSFNQNIGSWTVSSVTTMANMFRGASAFNQDISGWNVSSVTSMSAMFRSATSFNQNIGGWNTSSLTNAGSMFRGNTAFDQNIGSWDVSNITNFSNMFNGAKLSVSNYNALLVGWDAQTLQSGESFHAGNSKYCSSAAIAARANMIASDGWSISDGGVLTSFVWTGNTDTDWNTDTNWQDGYDSGCTLDISIPVVTNYPSIGASSEFTVNNLTIDSGASLTIEGGLTVSGNLTTNNGLTLNSGGSIIVNGTSSGNLTYNRSIANGGEYYYVSVPFDDEDIEDIIANNALATGNGNVGLFYYDNNTTSGYLGSGFIFYQPSSTESVVSARGYGIQLSASGNVTFTGTMPTTDASISISEGTMGDINPNPDNLIGNPFPSYIAANTNANANNLLSNNASILSEETMWFWDNTINDYVAINNASAAFYVAPGQGFFVSSTSSGGTFNILESWQSHQTDDVFYRDNSAPFRIKLTVKNTQNEQRFTEIFYFSNATLFFDNGYDSSKFNEDHNLDIYSRLVSEENSKNLSIQSVQNTDLESIVIPLGINASGNIALNLSTVNQPQGVNIYLEDRENNTFTKLTNESSLELSFGKSVNNIGRFYLHTKTKTLNTIENLLKESSIYLDNKTLVIKGNLNSKSDLVIFDILGKQMFSKKNLKTNKIELKTLKKGVYFIRLKNEKGIINKRVLLE